MGGQAGCDLAQRVRRVDRQEDAGDRQPDPERARRRRQAERVQRARLAHLLPTLAKGELELLGRLSAAHDLLQRPVDLFLDYENAAGAAVAPKVKPMKPLDLV